MVCYCTPCDRELFKNINEKGRKLSKNQEIWSWKSMVMKKLELILIENVLI
jgi:hypothetical protein